MFHGEHELVEEILYNSESIASPRAILDILALRLVLYFSYITGGNALTFTYIYIYIYMYVYICSRDYFIQAIPSPKWERG